jgi:hypothetical protein
MDAKKRSAWEFTKEANTAVSILLRLVPGAFVISAVGYATHLWAKFSHLLGVEQFVLVLCAIAATLLIWCAGVALWPVLIPKVKVSLSYHTTPNSEAVVTVTNKGSDGEFSAKGVILRPNKGQSPFQLVWQDVPEKETTIGKGDHSNLLIASVHDPQPYRLSQVTFWQNLGGKKEEFCRSLWNVQPKEILPVHLIQVTIFGNGKRGKCTAHFRVVPNSYTGPLGIEQCDEPTEEPKQGGYLYDIPAQ